ncbi:MAG: hypothetical protein Kow0092_14310 [Deferrisomatales bacterium]
MNGKVFEVVAYITRRYGADGSSLEDARDLRDELLDAGFEEDHVERALAWLRRLREAGVAPGGWMAPPSAAMRLPNDDEALRIAPEARGYLLRLERSGILDAAMREAVYERAVTLDVPEVGLDEVRVLVALLLKASFAADDRLVEGILEDDLGRLYH